MTGSKMLKLNEAAKAAVAAAGTGELSGFKLIAKLNELGVDVVLMDEQPPLSQMIDAMTEHA